MTTLCIGWFTLSTFLWSQQEFCVSNTEFFQFFGLKYICLYIPSVYISSCFRFWLLASSTSLLKSQDLWENHEPTQVPRRFWEKFRTQWSLWKHLVSSFSFGCWQLWITHISTLYNMHERPLTKSFWTYILYIKTRKPKLGFMHGNWYHTYNPFLIRFILSLWVISEWITNNDCCEW